MTMKNIARLTALAAALSFIAALPARAQWGPEEEKNCFTKGMKGTITIAGQTNSAQGDSSKLEQYEEIPKGFLVPCAAYGWENQTYTFDFKGIDVGYDDMFLGAGFGKKGGFKLGVSWDQNPNWQSNTARTPYTYSERGNTGYFAAPDDMQLTLQNIYTPWVAPTSSNPAGVGTAPANPTVKNFYAVGSYLDSLNLQPFDLRYVRKTGRAGVEIPVGKQLLFTANFSRETRKGNKNTTFYGGPDYEVATPIDYTTDDFRFGGEYAKGGFFANVSADFSNFSNQFQYNEIENPERLSLQNPNFPAARTVYNDVTLFRLWMPPDNKAYTVDATAGLNLPAHHKITGSLSTGEMKMDHELLNLSTNDALGLQPPNPAFTIVPPYSSVEAKYDTFMLNFRFTGDPSPYFGYIASYRKYELKDKTEEYEFLSVVRGDVGPSQRVEGGTGESGPLLREHFGWSVETLRGEVHVLPVHALRIGLSYNEDKRKFDVGEFEDVKDKTFVTSVDWGWQWVALHGNYTHLKRDPGTARDPAIWEGATFTDTGSRNRDTWSGLVTLTPVAKVAVSFTGQTQKNDFPESTTGLIAQKFDTFGVDLTYAANEKVNLTAGYVYEKYFFDMSAAYIPRGLNPPYDPANLWGNQTTDKVDTFRAGLSWAIVPEKLDFDATFDYTKPRSESLYDFAEAGTPIGGLNEANGIFPANVPPVPGFPVTTFDSFPNVVKKFTMAKLRLAYHLNKSFTASVLYWKQKYDNTDWQTEYMQPYMALPPSAAQPLGGDPGANRWFFLGARVPSYDADIFRVGLTYTF
jgi:hypothetical protein